ncbi:hypothetical protein Tco_1207122, partial [Tanacetum coccineum]
VQFHGGITVPAFARAYGPAAAVLNAGYVLLGGGGVCKEKRDGNKRKNTSRNRDCSFTTSIKTAVDCFMLYADIRVNVKWL